MIFEVSSPGLLTTVQDLGRWGYQGKGMPVAGAMDSQALKIGNILVGNEPKDAAFEITAMGPTLSVIEGEGLIAVTGAEINFTINKVEAPLWQSIRVQVGDTITLSTLKGHGCRAYLCVSGSIDVPVIMGSKSTYLRAKIGGLEGRALKAGDRIATGPLKPLTWLSADFTCPDHLRPKRELGSSLRVVLGPQVEAFTENGLKTFLESEYTITNEADRMGYRLEGPVIEHKTGADIISDAIPLGTIQVPGHGKPICMLADRQTTGGYTKIAVLCTPDIATLAHRMPGQAVHFKAISLAESIAAARKEREQIEELLELRASYRSRRSPSQTKKLNKTFHWMLKVRDKSYDVVVEDLN